MKQTENNVLDIIESLESLATVERNVKWCHHGKYCGISIDSIKQEDHKFKIFLSDLATPYTLSQNSELAQEGVGRVQQ